MKRNLSPLTLIILTASLVLGVIGSHIAYVMNANSMIAKEIERNPDLEGKIRINYGNIPHQEYLIYGLLIGLGIGTVLVIAFAFFSGGNKEETKRQE